MTMANARTTGMAPSRAAGALVNFVLFQLGWFACVIGAGRGFPMSGTAVALLIVAVHVLRAARPVDEMKLIGVALAIGLVWDSALASSGWIRFTSGVLVDGVAPPWILALWSLFATTLNVSLGWLKGRIVLAALLGAVAGPLSYWAGARFGAIDFIALTPALCALAIGWAVMTPLLVAAAKRFDGISPR